MNLGTLLSMKHIGGKYFGSLSATFGFAAV